MKKELLGFQMKDKESSTIRNIRESKMDGSNSKETRTTNDAEAKRKGRKKCRTPRPYVE